MPLRSIFLPAVALIAIFGIFVLPWHVPVGAPVYSTSYTYGFSNTAAQLCVAGVLVALALRGLRKTKSGGTDKLDEILTTLLTPSESTGAERGLIWAFGIVSCVAVAVVWGWYAWLPCAYFGESKYFLTRLDLMILGMKPYSDFQFTYGPAMLYPALWLYRLGFFSVEQSYCAMLLLHWLAGLFCLYYVCRFLGGKFPRAAVFLSIALPFINITLGLNVTPLRFALPLASILAFHRAVGKAALYHGRGAVPVVLGLCLALLNLAVSPEMGLAVTLALAAYSAALFRTPARRLAAGMVLLPVLLPAIMWIFTPGYFHGMISFIHGGDNDPVFPTIHIVTFLALNFWILPALAIIGFRNKSPAGAAAASLCVLLALLILPALGRCDAMHVFLNGIGVLLLFLSVVSLWKPGIFPACVLLYAIIFPVLGQVCVWYYYAPAVHQVLAVRSGLASYAQKDPAGEHSFRASSSPIRYSKLLPIPRKWAWLLRFQHIATPFGCDESMDRFLKITGRYVPGYYVAGAAGMEIYNEADLERDMADILRSNYLLLPPSSEVEYSQAVDKGALALRQSSELSEVMLLPIVLRAANEPFIPEMEIYKRIALHYTQVGTDGYYILLKKNTASP